MVLTCLWAVAGEATAAGPMGLRDTIAELFRLEADDAALLAAAVVKPEG